MGPILIGLVVIGQLVGQDGGTSKIKSLTGHAAWKIYFSYLTLVLFGEEEDIRHVVGTDHLAEVLLAMRL